MLPLLPNRFAAILAAFATFTPLSAQLEHRQSELTVEVRNSGGDPLQGATVSVKMLDHQFRFGVALSDTEILRPLRRSP